MRRRKPVLSVLTAVFAAIAAGCAGQNPDVAASDGVADPRRSTDARAIRMESPPVVAEELSSTAAPISESHREAAREALRLTRARKGLEYLHDQIYPALIASHKGMDLDEQHAEIYQRAAQGALDLMRELMTWERMEAGMIDIYTRVYTEGELHELNAFYRTPVGQKMIDKTPQLMQESTRFTQELLAEFLPRLKRHQEETLAELMRELEESQRSRELAPSSDRS